jgi:4-hydroxybenzoate polyprenyltransferase
LNRPPEKLHALAATARIANIPSVAGNVFLGIALAKWTGLTAFDQALQVVPATLLITAGTCLYLAGNFLNDWADREQDAVHRPERALPRGLFAPGTYLAMALGFGLLGLGAASAVHLHCLLVALTIAACIVLYTCTHKRSPWSVVPMGLCRALLPVLGFAGFATRWAFSPALFAAALGLFCHIVGLSLSARCESMQPAPTGLLRFARLWFLPAALSMFLTVRLGLSFPLAASLYGLPPYALWIALCLTVFRKPVHVHVSSLLAGIPLIDWIVLLPLGLSSAMSGPFSTACLVIPPLAFFLGKALQRLAPAT